MGKRVGPDNLNESLNVVVVGFLVLIGLLDIARGNFGCFVPHARCWFTFGESGSKRKCACFPHSGDVFKRAFTHA